MRPDALPDRVEVARVLRAHGVRGEVGVATSSDTDGRFDVGATLWHDDRRLCIRSRRRHRGGLLLAFDGIEDRDAADDLRGAVLTVPLSEVPSAPEGEYYFFELEGCSVVDSEEGELGTVVQVHEDGGGLLLEVELGEDYLHRGGIAIDAERGSAKVLIPFVRRHLERVDIEARTIETRLPVGLVAACVSTS